MMLSVSKLADNFGISRSTLLYYDSINLLKPSVRNKAGYRLYDEADIERLRKIRILKEAGVPLSTITKLLNSANVEVTALLLKRLGQLNKEVQAVKQQQNVIIKLLENSALYKNLKYIDENTWLSILNAAGIQVEKMEEWHSQFIKHSPSQQSYLLELLGFSDEDSKKTKEHSLT